MKKKGGSRGVKAVEKLQSGPEQLDGEKEKRN